MSSEPNVVPTSSNALRNVPRAVWIGVGSLGLVTAALAGALVMRSVEPSSAAPAVAQANAVGEPMLSTAESANPAQPAKTMQPMALASTKPARHAQSVPSESASPAQANALGGTAHAALCATCGVVESVSAVQEKGQGTGRGAVAGGLLGGVVGHQVGRGNGNTAMTVLGAIGGGLAGNEVEKRARAQTLFDIQVRMEDGSIRNFQRAQSMTVGTHVVVEGTALRVARDNAGTDAQRAQRTSVSVGARG